MIKLLKVTMLLTCFLMTAACATSGRLGVQEEFEKSYKAFNRMLRWDEVAGAGMIYMEPEGREQYIKDAAEFKKKAVTITDYRVMTAEYAADKGTGEVSTEFDYYIMPSNRIKTLTYKQSWVYRDIKDSKSWKVKSQLPGFE